MNDKYICTFFMPWEQKSERYKREEKNFAYDYRLCESKDFGRSLRIEPGEKQPCNGRNDVDASWKCESKDSNRSVRAWSWSDWRDRPCI